MEKVQAVTDFIKNSKIFANSNITLATASKKGETFELKAELNADTKDKRKDAVKKTIANMTVGKDVSMLFADVVKNMQTEDLELKKLVYLYLINYAKSQPELVILAVNTFVKDADDPNPLIRALSIRTMGCLRVPKVLDYICDPLRKLLKDDHPYVRKTAAICVAKLHDLNPNLTFESGFIQILQDMLSDSNPMVVANSVAALLEIKSTSNRKDIFALNTALVQKLLAALNDATEWGQISILEALASCVPADSREAEMVVERVLPRLQHANASVVLTAVKVLVIYLEYITTDDTLRQLIKKLSPPLVSLLTASPEIQYVVIRNIHLIMQKYPDILQNETRVFFCQYNDPPYVKLEKLEIMINLAAERNIDQVLSELKEYANEVDVDFVRKSVRAIGRCAIKIDSATERCVTALLDLIKNRVNYVVQEAVIVIKDIFRKFPNRYESVIPVLCESLDVLEEPEAKAAMIWIIGENAHRVENAKELIEGFLETFKTESSQVQLQLLTATVKLFLKKPQTTQELVQKVLQNTTTQAESADIRDKAYIYWRLLSSDPAAAKAVVLADKPPISSQVSHLNGGLLSELIANLTTVSSIYHKPPSMFLSNTPIEIVKQSVDEEDGPGGDLLVELDGVLGGADPSSPGHNAAGGLVDFLSDDPSPAAQQQSSGLAGVFTTSGAVIPKALWLSAQQAKGFELLGTFSVKNGAPSFDLTLCNKSLAPMTDFAIQFNKNSFGLIPAVPLQTPTLMPQQSFDVSVPLANNGPVGPMAPLNLLQVAIKNNMDVFYFQVQIPLLIFFQQSGVDQEFVQLFAAQDVPNNAFTLVHPAEQLATKLGKNGVFVQRADVNKYQLGMRIAGVLVCAEWSVGTGNLNSFAVKSRAADLLPLIKESFELVAQFTP